MGAIRWSELRKVEVPNFISVDEIMGYYQLHLTAEYRRWLTWDQDGEFLLHIYHTQKSRIELLKQRIEDLYKATVENDRLIKTGNKTKKRALIGCMLLLITMNVFLCATGNPFHWNVKAIVIFSIVAIVYITLAFARTNPGTRAIPWKIPLLGATKLEKQSVELIWAAFRLRMDIRAEFNPLGF